MSIRCRQKPRNPNRNLYRNISNLNYSIEEDQVQVDLKSMSGVKVKLSRAERVALDCDSWTLRAALAA